MSHPIYAKATAEGGFEFQSEYHKHLVKERLKNTVGMVYKITPLDSPVSDEMRGYMFGAVIPFLRTLSAFPDTLTDEQVHEMLKKEFNFFEAIDPVTKRKERYGLSVMNKAMKNRDAMEFIERIANWVLENFNQTLPDPEEYKRWRDSAPTV